MYNDCIMDEYLKHWVMFNDRLHGEKEYRLTMSELKILVREFQVENYDGFVSNDESWIEYWLEKNQIYEI